MRWWVVVTMVCSLWACESRSLEPRFERKSERSPESASADESPAPRPQAPGQAELAQAAARAVPQAADEPRRPKARRPTSPDPVDGKFSLAQATEGLGGKGKLKATIETSLGTLECTLYADKAPNTVANFVGLARGKRPFWDPFEAEWVKRPLYDGTSFHRVIPGFMIQGGDHLGDGSGGVGYVIDDELHPSLKHDRAGLLCMANRGPDTNGGQFFITDAAAPHLTAMKSYTIFGECGPTSLISKIARVPKDPVRRERPSPPVEIKSVRITR